MHTSRLYIAELTGSHLCFLYCADMENRLGVDDRGRVYAAYPYGDGRDIMHVKIEHDEDKASHASDEDDDDDDEAESDYEEQLKVRQTDELCFSTGDCLYILQRPDTNSESNDKWWLAEHASQPSQSRGYVPCTHLSVSTDTVCSGFNDSFAG